MKNIIFAMMSVVCLCLASACSKDEEPVGSGVVNTGKQLVEITTTYTYNGQQSDNHHYTLTYDAQGRVSKIESEIYYSGQSIEKGTTTFNYSQNQIIENSSSTTTSKVSLFNRTESSLTTYTISGGLITHSKEDRIYEYGDDSMEIDYSYANNRLVRETVDDETTAYNWDTNGITKMESDGYKEIYKFSDIKCPMVWLENPLPYSVLAYAGYFGENVTNLIESSSWGNRGSQMIVTKFEYTLDEDGYPIKAVSTSDSESSTTTFIWK